MNDYLIEELQEKKELIKDLYNECVSLRGINTGLKKENKDLKQRIDKAIEYCNNGIKEYITDDGFVEEVLQDVLDILKGKEDEEN